MKTFIVLATLLVAALALPADSEYSSEFDSINVEEVVANARLLKNYMNCLLDKGPCTSAGKFINSRIPDALSTECAKCSARQRPLIRTVIRAFKDQLPEQWKELTQKHDPTNKYQDVLEKFVNASD